ncbi:YggS family pyridoxal phosphate-dependent enzyme [Brachybacterium huguangmaarense]|uniref:Pyridoxal phosphate homeostasis protein n=1 Tax=Brachybacterium huguangmaarense TaxID=1652028 RepID=A0ABY6G1T9_9MICO|nr:YggS family pyridoxal phosphate-dependent enzyme [Brachybacterium huguangmaarense]UYG17170.1 YggS family pyridoxal phosphate-dependent enzyme [Brachybacterium huguangmaarense]
MNARVDLSARIDDVLARLDGAARRAGRDGAEVQILLATKTRTAAEIADAVRGFRARGRDVVVGENRAQEIAKHDDPALVALGVPRHFIGRLQTNKAKDVVAFASVIHSVDRDAVIDALARRAELADVERDVLLQVNTSGEQSKGGYAPDAATVQAALERVAATGRLRPVGLMTIGAHTDDEASVRASLGALRVLRDEIAMPGVTELSMGMSGDLEIAVEEGSTIVRLGSAVFGPRAA